MAALLSVPNMSLISATKRKGLVIRAKDSYVELEAVAHQRDAKGVYFERGPHQREADIQQWVAQYSDGDISCQTLLVAPPVQGNTGSGEDYPKLEGTSALDAACAKLVAELPCSFRESVRCDAQSIAEMCLRLCPAAPWLTIKLEVQQHNACTRWHQDSLVSRAIICYTGPGTCTAADQSVRWDKIKRYNETCVPCAGMTQMSTNAVLLMKGIAWPWIQGKGLTHKSPDDGINPPPKRLLLKVDLENVRHIN